jgi:glycosyltransferase A (GT-A) superfamily protein (DUF2064 family)
MTTLIVIAKECVPGRVKTRLHPPLSLEQAAQLAEASLVQTLEVAANLPFDQRILYFDGNLLPQGSEHFTVIAQTSGTLDERLGAIFDQCDGPTFLIGMDTPQLTAALLAPVLDEWDDEVDAWFGPALDGGFWGLGLRTPNGDLIRGVPMSEDDTGDVQLKRLTDAGLRVQLLQPLVDVDTIESAREVADLAPDSLFASTLAAVIADGMKR